MMLSSRKPTFTLAFLLIFFLGLSPAWGQWRVIRHHRTRKRIHYLHKIELRIYQLTNLERRKRHLNPLSKDEALVKVARAHSDDMLRQDYFSHVDPNGKAPKDRVIPAYSRAIARIGENIWGGHGYDYSDSKRLARVIVDSWMASPEHRANLLNPHFNYEGVGVSVSGKEIRATQDFVQR
jgi:uncharacterized protein YkwD